MFVCLLEAFLQLRFDDFVFKCCMKYALFIIIAAYLSTTQKHFSNVIK